MEEKKAFLLYKNYIKQVDMLSDEAAGRLFKAILHYVNGASPVGFDPKTEKKAEGRQRPERTKRAKRPKKAKSIRNAGNT